MDPVKIIELKESILEDNDKDAAVLRDELKQKKLFLMTLTGYKNILPVLNQSRFD